MQDKNNEEEREENIAPGKNWKLLRASLKNLNDAAWAVHKECPIWGNIDGTIQIRVRTLNDLILARMAADELLNNS